MVCRTTSARTKSFAYLLRSPGNVWLLINKLCRQSINRFANNDEAVEHGV